MTEHKEIVVAFIGVFGAMIVAFIGMASAVITYLLQKNKELNLKIAEQKREEYAIFLKNFT